MSGRAYRNKKRMVVQETPWWDEMAEWERAAQGAQPGPEERRHPASPVRSASTVRKPVI